MNELSGWFINPEVCKYIVPWDSMVRTPIGYVCIWEIRPPYTVVWYNNELVLEES